MCTLGFQGKGYSSPFIENYREIVTQLETDPNTLIEITSTLDSVCQACPHQTEDRLCNSQIKIEKLDLAHQKILGLFEGQILSWKQAKKLIQKYMTLPAFHLACEGCEWKGLGVCENALKKLIL